MSRKKGNRQLEFTRHHRVPVSKGGKDGDSVMVNHKKHQAWHTLVKNKSPKKAAIILSIFLPEEYRFFVFDKKTPIDEIIRKVKIWRGEEEYLSKIIQFQPYCNSNSPDFILLKNPNQ